MDQTPEHDGVVAEAESELLRMRLQLASAAMSARAAHLSNAEVGALTEQARTEANEE